jgi:hypothetical protein
MTDIHPGIIAGVRLTAKHMTTDELVAINLAAQLRTDPRGVMGYVKALPLFTEDRGTRMRTEVLTVFSAIVNERLAQESEK